MATFVPVTAVLRACFLASAQAILMLRSPVTVSGTNAPTRGKMHQQTTENKTMTPVASEGSLRAHSDSEITRHFANSIR